MVINEDIYLGKIFEGLKLSAIFELVVIVKSHIKTTKSHNWIKKIVE